MTVSTTSLYDQGNGNVAKETVAEPLLKDVNAWKDGSVVEVSFTTTEYNYVISTLSEKSN